MTPWLTLSSSQGGDVSRLGTDIVDNGSLEPRDDKVGSFVVDLLLDTKDTGVLDSTVTTVDYVCEFQGEEDGERMFSFPSCLWVCKPHGHSFHCSFCPCCPIYR